MSSSLIQSSRYFAVLSRAIRFILCLVSFEKAYTDARPGRTLRLSSRKLKFFLTEHHTNPISELYSVVKAHVTDASELEPLLEELSFLIDLLDTAQMDSSSDIVAMTVEEREKYSPATSKDDEKRSDQKQASEMHHSFSDEEIAALFQLPAEEYRLEIPSEICRFNTRTDLMQFACKHLVIDEAEAEKRLRKNICRKRQEKLDTASSRLRHFNLKKRKGQLAEIHLNRSSRKFALVAPMRGRGFIIKNSVPYNRASSSLNANQGTTSTEFRTINTSRPVSMHVDEFNKLENDESAIIMEDPLKIRKGRIATDDLC
ncbi:hypothetical protein Ciccas_012208 [Cichlidogyrus casuarinus]|uniref:Uncharacterized protein n=1 Tax=Cichlidogyrus casuarinus TaxID=1844966 RepID=A0ABD2PQU8_9PLAT